MGKREQLTASIFAIFMMTTVFFIIIQMNIQNVYIVKVGSSAVGEVSNPQVVKSWIDRRNEQLKEKYPNANVRLVTENITYEPVSLWKKEVDDKQLLGALSQLVPGKAFGTQLVINGKAIGIVKDRATADRLIKFVKDRQMKKISEKLAAQKGKVETLSANGTGQHEKENREVSELQTVGFVENYDLQDVTVSPENVVESRTLLERIETGNVGPHIYTVKEGDCVSCIAEDFNIPPSIIYENNPGINDEELQIGDQLNLTIKKPLLSVRTVERIVEREEIEYTTNYVKDDSLRAGKTRTVTKGKTGLREITMLVTKIGGEIVKEETVSEVVLRKPEEAVVRRGTKIIPGEGTGSFMIPVRGARLSSRYGMRGGRMHRGIDFTSGNRTILAADNGRVTFVGRMNGYGNTIIINHQNGFQTKYAHLSSFKVRTGERVEKGDSIGVMGNTGNSSGVHLHFEIHRNGQVVNPSKYLYR